MSVEYYEGELSIANSDQKRSVRIIVSDFYGTQELYLRVDEDEPRTMMLTKEEAREFLAGLQGAMDYLGYTS